MLKFYSNDKSKHPEILKSSVIDSPLYGVFLLFCIIDLLSFIENIVRNMGKLGVAEEFAAKFWSWQFFYNNYELLKAVLLGLMFMTLFACAYIANKQSKRMSHKELS